MYQALDASALDQLFCNARTHNAWQPREVSDAQLHQLYELARFGPTSANCSPARIVFVKSAAAKRRLGPALSEMDMEFHEQLPKLFPHTDARSWFVGNDALIASTAFRNSSLQGAYLILAARALGLDCGPMSGFDNAKVDAEFFAGTSIKSNFLVNLGYGDASVLFPRSPRLEFDEACSIL